MISSAIIKESVKERKGERSPAMHSNEGEGEDEDEEGYGCRKDVME
jgi:hypothetical protein